MNDPYIYFLHLNTSYVFNDCSVLSSDEDSDEASVQPSAISDNGIREHNGPLSKKCHKGM